MRSSGNPDTAYSVAEKARVGLNKIVDFTGERLGNLLQLSLLLPVLIWLFSWVISLFQPGSNWAVVGTLHMILLFGMIWGFLSRNDTIAYVFPAIFWMHTFVRTFSGLSTYTWSYYLAQTILLFFVASAVCGIFSATNMRKHPVFKRARPIIRLVTTVLVTAGTILGAIFFLLNINTKYFDFSSLIMLLGSALMLMILSGDFKTEKWMKPVQKYGPLLFFGLLLVFSLLDGILGLIALKGTVSSLQLLFLPLLINIFISSFILPANFISTHHLNGALLNEMPDSSDMREKMGDKALSSENEDDQGNPLSTSDPSPATVDTMATADTMLTPDTMPTQAMSTFPEDQAYHFVAPEYQVAQHEQETWQNPLIEPIDPPSAWQPLPLDMNTTYQDHAPLIKPTRVDSVAPTPMPVMEEQQAQPAFVAPRRVDLPMQDMPVEPVQSQSVLTAETKVLPRVTEADLATSRAKQTAPEMQPNPTSTNIAKPQIRRVDTEN